MPSRLVHCLLLFLSTWTPLGAADPAPEPPGLRRMVAVTNVCAWPNLTVLPDGTITAVIFNRPAHGTMEGDPECWASTNGEYWEKRGTVTRHLPHTVRMNIAAGTAENGDLLVVCSGWTNVKQPQWPKESPFRDAIIRSWTCRSSDGGRTWITFENFPGTPEPGHTELIPFGDIVPAADGSLRLSVYQGRYLDASKSRKTGGWQTWMFRSTDDGNSWEPLSKLSPRHNETQFIQLGEKEWLAAARTEAMDLFRSTDDGQTWSEPLRVTRRNEINGHLLHLTDGRLVLSYGNRIQGEYGVLARISRDQGRTWGNPLRLAHSQFSDCGYPSTVQRPDGTLVTAYYSKAAPEHDGYHMGVALWQAPELQSPPN